MRNEIEQKIDSLLDNLSKKSEKYSIALLNKEGYNKRKAIRHELREIESKITVLREQLKTDKP